MSIKIGLYDFFSNTISGCFYLISVFYIGEFYKDNYFYNYHYDLISILIICFFGYVTGLIMDHPACFLWYNRFKPKNIKITTLHKYQKKYPEFSFRFNSDYFPILLQYLKNKNEEVGLECTRFDSLHIMIRNFSFAFVILFFSEIIKILSGDFTIINWILLFTFAGLAIISMQRSLKFLEWYFETLLESYAAFEYKPSDWLGTEKSS
ncbi:MAG: hypothetical protein R6W90_15725 [Ignavibacteriaceae bacterium]